MSLAAVLIVPPRHTASGRVALTLACYTTKARLTLFHLPTGASWSLSLPPALPNLQDEREGLTLDRLGGARLTIETEGKRQVLNVPAVRLLRELREALITYDC